MNNILGGKKLFFFLRKWGVICVYLLQCTDISDSQKLISTEFNCKNAFKYIFALLG